MDRHLSEQDIEALAHGRHELASKLGLGHVAQCQECAETVRCTRLLSARLGLELREQFGASTFDLDDLVGAVMNDSALNGVRVPSVPVPARTTLISGLFGGLLIAITTGVLSEPNLPSHLPSLTTAYEILRIARAVMAAVDQVVSHLPGGWGLVMVGAWLLLALLLVPARFLLVRVRMRAPNFANGLMLLAVLWMAQPARALDIEGALPEQKRVSLSVMREATSKVLGRVADAAGLNLVSTLPDDPLVSVRVKQATLREVLTAVLGEQPVVVHVDGKMLIVRSAAPVPPSDDTVPMVTTPVQPAESANAPPDAPILGVAVPGAPPLPPLPPPPARPAASKKRATDRVVMGGSSTVAAGDHVRDAIVVGGNLTVYGVVEGDAVAIGGHVHLMPGSLVKGELLALGGSVTQEKGATVLQDGDDDSSDADKDADEDADDDDDEAVVAGSKSDHGGSAHPRRDDQDDDGKRKKDEDDEDGWLAHTLSSASSHALLFVFGLVLLGIWPRRIDALQRAMTAAPLRTFALGVLGALCAPILCVLLTITILGIPAAIVLALASALAMYAGVAASALAVGKILPIRRLVGSPVLQLGAGVFVLFLLARIPVLGVILFVVAAALGIGAIVRTRLSEAPPLDPGSGDDAVGSDVLVSNPPGE